MKRKQRTTECLILYITLHQRWSKRPVGKVVLVFPILREAGELYNWFIVSLIVHMEEIDSILKDTHKLEHTPTTFPSAHTHTEQKCANMGLSLGWLYPSSNSLSPIWCGGHSLCGAGTIHCAHLWCAGTMHSAYICFAGTMKCARLCCAGTMLWSVHTFAMQEQSIEQTFALQEHSTVQTFALQEQCTVYSFAVQEQSTVHTFAMQE